MNIESAKLELVRQILELESADIVNKLFKTLKEEKSDFWLDLTEDQKNEIELGIRQIENGQSVDWEEFKKKIS